MTGAPQTASTGRERVCGAPTQTTGTPQEGVATSGGTCACGAPVGIRKTGECRRCYNTRWNSERRAERLTGVCSACGASPIVAAGSQRCARCIARARSKRRPFRATQPSTYVAAHALVRRVRGQASMWSCTDCGGRAEQWAYRPGGPRERVTVERNGTRTQRRRWSPDPADYDPLCVDCHQQRDRPGAQPGYRQNPAKAREYRRRWRHAQRANTTLQKRRREQDRKNDERRRRRASDQRAPSEQLHPARAWALANGLPVNPRGRIPSAVLSAWHAASAPEPHPRSPAKTASMKR